MVDRSLQNYGWIEGGYLFTCYNCHEESTGAKRSIHCKECATEGKEEWESLSPEEQEARREKTRLELQKIDIWLNSL